MKEALPPIEAGEVGKGKQVPQALKRPCKNMGSETSKEVLKLRHKDKMEVKRRLRELNQADQHFVRANLSKKHPDYGKSPTEHANAKRDRAVSP